MKYYLDKDGYVMAYGYILDGIAMIGNEPFLSQNGGSRWRCIDGIWVDEKADYKYFLIPSDMVSQIANYAGFVKEALFELSFNVKVNEIPTIVEGEEVKSPLFINFIPCSCTRWTDEGLQLLDAVIDYWNSANVMKQIGFDVKFESYNELIAFRNSNTL